MSSDKIIGYLTSAVPDASLLEAITQGNEAAMAIFYSRHAVRVYSVAVRVLHDPTAGEDVLQEVFLQIWRGPTIFAATCGSFEGRLAMIARDRALNVLRRNQRFERSNELPSPYTPQVGAEMAHNISAECAKRAVADLPYEQREALEAAFFAGVTHVEIAKQTGDPPGVVKARLRLAIHTLGQNFLRLRINAR